MKIQLENIVALSATPQKVLKNTSYYPLQLLKKLTPNDVRTPQFHILLEIHKPSISGRPVVRSVECYSSKILKFVDHYVRPPAETLPSYIKDIVDFINKINGVKNISEEIFLVTLDIRSLYSNIPNHEGIEAANEALS